ncbi:hypothetical protein [Rickettsia hoogstraalii]|nr:hypothetical protein [Rickettsia hoogstraalii]
MQATKRSVAISRKLKLDCHVALLLARHCCVDTTPSLRGGT